MKLILTILFLFAFKAQAQTIYYVSSSDGNDSDNGLSEANAWLTVAKVNASSFAPGDEIRFKMGDSWNEKLIIPSSGTEGNPITFGSYGTGNKPIITGLQTQGGFTDVGNVWTATATNSVKSLNTVLVSGFLKAKARTPNTTYNTFSAYSGNTQITTALTGTPDYTGSEIVVRTAHWIIDVAKITSQAAGVLDLWPPLTYTPEYGGNGWFFQGNAADLDASGEWSYDSTTKVLKVYSTTSPDVQISTIDTLVHLNNKDYITFDGLNITGANVANIIVDTSDNVTIQNCTINFSGAYGIIGHVANYLTLKKDSVLNSLSNGIYLRIAEEHAPTIGYNTGDDCDYAIVDSCYVKNSAIYAGMGLNKNGRYEGMYIIGHYVTVTNNTVDSSGYSAIDVKGKGFLIKNNYITNHQFLKDDGGGIYTGIGGSFAADFCDSGRIISNIVVNGGGLTGGTTAVDGAAGIFVDALGRLVTVDSNTVVNSQVAAFKTYQVESISAKFNNIINNNGYPRYLQSTFATSNFKNNAYLSNSASWNCLFTEPVSIATSDSNYFSRPLSETNLFRRIGTEYTLAGFVTLTGQESHSYITPVRVTAAAPLVVYNPTLEDSVINFTGLYVDIRGNFFNDSITLGGYRSNILYKSINEIPGPGGSQRIGNLIFN